jgi:hypothetical protein
VAGRTGAVTLVSADISDATSAATANKLALRGANGQVAFSSNSATIPTLTLSNGGVSGDGNCYTISSSSNGSGISSTCGEDGGSAFYGSSPNGDFVAGRSGFVFSSSQDSPNIVAFRAGWASFGFDFFKIFNNGTINVGSDVFNWPNFGGIIAVVDAAQSWSGTQTFSGAMVFTNAARPTSSASGSPDATSLMTRNDVDAAAFDNFGTTIRVTNPTFSATPTGGTSGSTFPHFIAVLACGTSANGYARASFNRGLNQVPGLTGNGITFSQPVSVAMKLTGYFENSTTKFRLIVGGNNGVPATADNDALSVVGYGFELAINASNFVTIAAFAHNGTTFVKATPTVTSLTRDSMAAQFSTFVVSSNGTGTITVQYKTGRTVNSTSTTTGGPTTAGILANAWVDAATVNGASNAANTRISIQDFMIKLS